MNFKALSFLLITVCVSMSCKQQVSDSSALEEREMFTYASRFSPTPIENAATRYTDFVSHLRKAGDESFQTFHPDSVVPTDDKSVMVNFVIKIPAPTPNQEYESYISYRLDGQEQKGTVQKSVLVGRSASGD